MAFASRSGLILPDGLKGIAPQDMHKIMSGSIIQVPDPVTWIVSPEYLNRPSLYPRQATLMKIVFLREDLFTDYDYEVVAEWQESFRQTNYNGVAGDLLERMRYLKAQGYPWFREVLLVMGRRAGKGHMTALMMSYVLWHYMSRPGGPQAYYGVDRDKKLMAMVFAGKREQAKAQVWQDLVNVISGSTCFAPYISRLLGESLTIYAPSDWVRMKEMERKGINAEQDMASFGIVPKESTLMAGRGPTSFMQCLDPSTPVLLSDLTWKPIGEIREGDSLIGLDEEPITGQRKMRESLVEKVWETQKEALRITFDDGSSVVCSPDHRWLVKEMGKGGYQRWMTAGSLHEGHRVKAIVDPWGKDTSWSAGYLSGFYDGEGCISGWSGRAGKETFVTQNPGPTLDGALGMLRDKGYHPKRSNAGDQAEQWSLANLAENMRFLGSIRPSRLMSKARLIWDGVSPRGTGHKTIVGIEELPPQRLIDITTTTRTFIANGLVSHNCYDEMAHVVASGANRSAEEVYQAATPALDQFGKDAFIVEPSSPWQMMGQFYENYQHSLELNERGTALYPEIAMFQLASWDIYKDWEKAGEIPLFPPEFDGDLGEYRDSMPPTFHPLKGAIQTYDESMERLKRANPETFAVERESRFATAIDAYLNSEKVAGIFSPWEERPQQYGPPAITTQTGGLLMYAYKGHADPSKVNDKYGLAIAHTETDEAGRLHCVFDLIRHFDPADYPDGIIDYEQVDDWIWDNVITKFYPEEFTYDQYNSPASVQKLQKRIRNTSMPKRVTVFEKTTTRQYDWTVKESAKAAINLGLVHAPYNERADLELRFLQMKNGRVDHPSAGPVQSKDIADCMMEVIHVLIGEQVNNFMHADLSNFRPRGALQGGVDPFPHMREDPAEALSNFGNGARGSDPDRPEWAPQRRGAKRHRF